MGEAPLPSRLHVDQVVQDPVELLPSEGERDPVDHLAVHDQADPVLRREDAVRDPEGRPDRVFDRIVRLRAHGRLAPRVDHDDHVPRALPLVLVREESLEARRRLPIDAAHFVPRDVLPDAPELGARTDPTGSDLPEPRAGPPRLERGAAQVLHRGGDDER